VSFDSIMELVHALDTDEARDAEEVSDVVRMAVELIAELRASPIDAEGSMTLTDIRAELEAIVKASLLIQLNPVEARVQTGDGWGATTHKGDSPDLEVAVREAFAKAKEAM